MSRTIQRFVIVFGLLLALLPSLIVHAQDVPTITWVAQYYNNATLSGSPISIINEPTPTHNWGLNAPASNLPVDGFSARWSGTAIFTGTFQISVVADDGVRVYVNSQLLIDQWHDASGQTYTATFTGTSNSVIIVVEYYENGGNASLQFDLTNTGSSGGGGGSGNWSAQYYNNTTLTDPVVVTQKETSPTHNWGTGSPVSGVNADNFSARWAATVTLDGWYRVSAKADDGVRVWVNGVLVIDEWHASNGQTYSYDFYLSNSSYLVVIEYYEASGNAYLEYGMTKISDPGTGGGGGTGSGSGSGGVASRTAVVTTHRLNVRQTPTVGYNNILLKINRGENYPVVGRLSDNSWWQIQIGSTLGWVYGSLVSVADWSGVPVTYGPGITASAPTLSQPVPIIGVSNQSLTHTGYLIGVRANLNVRVGPGVSFQLIDRIQYDERAEIVARTADSSWWLVDYEGTIGWVSGLYVLFPYNFDYTRVPVGW